MSVSLSLVALLAGPPDYAGWQAIRVVTHDHDEWATARSLVDDVPAHLPARATTWPAELPALASPQARAALSVAGLEFRVTTADVGDAIALERDRIEAAERPRSFDAWFEEFQDGAAIDAQLDVYADSFPDTVSVVPVGTSLDARPIRAVRISGSTETAPALVYVGGQHAREWIGPMVSMCVADHFARGYGEDDEVTRLLDRVEIHVLPMANPDGYDVTWTTDRLWRKNTRDGTGVDLNRNWSEGWGIEPGSSGAVDDPTYRGANAFSEPETAAIRDWVQALDDPRILVDFHSIGAVIVSSWAYTDTPPDDLQTLVAIGDAMEAHMDEIGPHDFQSLHGANANAVLGNASGTLPDWTHANIGVPAFTVELPPSFIDGPEGWGFEIPPDAIIPICEQAIAAVTEQARWIASGPLNIAIADPVDGSSFDGPVTIPISMDVVNPGPVEVGLRIDGVDTPWVDLTNPFHAGDVLFPLGTFTLEATARTWDGEMAVSDPVTITVVDPSSADDETAGAGTDGGEVGTGTTDTEGGMLDGNGGCACGVGRRTDTPAWLLFGLVAWRRRSRR